MPEKSEEFASRIASLVADFESALAGTEWVTRRYPKKMEDENDSDTRC